MRKRFILKAALTAAALFAAIGFASCSKSGEAKGRPAGFELALITDLGTIDDKSFNQGSWEGLNEYAGENGITSKYYQPAEQSDHAYTTGIDLAVKGGARVVVTPGFLFEVPVWTAQDRYPDVSFILVDGTPHNSDYSNFTIGPRTVGVTYAEEEAGFLAGYAAVKDGYKKLGFMGGMAVPPVVRYGYGFLQGADAAAVELGVGVAVNYHYTGGFSATPEAQALAAAWYNGGVEVIFACGGAVGNSVMAAAEQAGKKVIGVDVDQSYESPSVIVSAIKALKHSVYDSVQKYYEGKFPGGQHIIFSAANDGIGLTMDTAKFNKFTSDDYADIYSKLKSKSVSIKGDVDSNGSSLSINQLPLKAVAVVEVK